MNKQDEFGYMALMRAKWDKCVRLLLNAGADVNICRTGSP